MSLRCASHREGQLLMCNEAVLEHISNPYKRSVALVLLNVAARDPPPAMHQHYVLVSRLASIRGGQLIDSFTHSFQTYARQAQQALLGMYGSNQLSLTSWSLCYLETKLCMKGDGILVDRRLPWVFGGLLTGANVLCRCTRLKDQGLQQPQQILPRL